MPERVFRSRLYPTAPNRAALLGMSLVGPLGTSMVPVMLGALVSMLTTGNPMGWLYVGFPAALAVASGWTVLQLRRRVVEVLVRHEAVSVRSAWEVAGSSPATWLSVLDVSRAGGVTTVTLGHDSRSLQDADWENAAQVAATLHQAADVFAGRVYAEVT